MFYSCPAYFLTSINVYKDQNYDETLKSMKKFEKMRIKSDFFSKNGEYIIGTIILNHILSTIDTLYLLNLKKNQNITLIPVISKYYSKINLIINF